MTLKSQEYEGACVILGRVHAGRTSTYLQYLARHLAENAL